VTLRFPGAEVFATVDGMGKQLLKKYSVIKKLREVGGYFEVYRAHQTGLDRDVELRLLKRPVPHDVNQFKRFRQQFQALARLDHPAIVKVLDVGYTKTRIYYTTEFRNSVSMAELLTTVGGPLTRQEVIEVAEELGSALVHIHDKGLLHRNVNLKTVFFDLDNKRPYISEFALVKDIEMASLPAGSTRIEVEVVPTPEFYDDVPFDQQTDLFMFGALLYQLATYRSPFPPAERLPTLSPDEIFDVTPPSSLNVDVSSKLDTLIMRLLARQRGDRFATAQAFVDALGRKRRLMDFDSMINQERREIIKGIRRSMKLPEEEPSPATEAVDEGSDEPVPAPRAFEAMARLAAAGGDSMTGLIMILCLFTLAGGMWLGWPLLGDRAPTIVDTRRPTASLMKHLSEPPSTYEEDVVKIVAEVQLDGMPTDTFLKRWDLLRAYVLSLPEELRAKAVPYNRLLGIKLQFHRDPEGACQSLREAFTACDGFIKSPAARLSNGPSTPSPSMH